MSEPIRIALVIDVISSPTAGTEKQLCTIIDNLDRNRFAPCLCLLRESDWSRREFDGERYVVGVGSYLSPGSWRQIYRFASYLRRERFRIVHTFHRDGEIVGSLAARLAGISSIIGSRRDQGYWLNGRERLIRAGLRKWHRGYVTNAYSTREWLMREESLTADRIQVIPNGVALRMFAETADRASAREELGLAAQDLAIACVATLRPVKRHADLMLGFQTALREEPRWKLVLIGDGECRADLERQALELGIAERVLFVGTRQDIPRLLSGMDLGTLFSESESMSNTLLEYLAAGLPVVSSDVGDARHLVTEGENGHLVAVGDVAGLATAFSRLADPVIRLRMAEVSRERSLGYDAADSTRRFEEYYERCLQ